MTPVSLAATLHDPEARLLPAIERDAARLAALFGGIALNATDATPVALIEAARQRLGAKVVVHAVDERRIGSARREALRLALEFSTPSILYCDFDHLLRWVATDETEFRATLASQPGADVLVIGRSPSAFAAEPERLRATESVVNRIYEIATGRRWDLMFAVRRLSRRAAEIIVRSSRVDSIANDVEWPLLAEAHGLTLGYAQADGLFYRTIEEFGSAADTRDGDAMEWVRRLQIAAEQAAVFRSYLTKS